MLEDFDLVIQYGNQIPIKINTHHIQEDILRMKIGLEPHKENDNHFNEKDFENFKNAVNEIKNKENNKIFIFDSLMGVEHIKSE